MLAFVLVLLLAILVLGIVTTPLRPRAGDPSVQTDDRVTVAAAEVENLEAERDAKYREIRDAELDRQTGHLSDHDFATIDGDLRAQAIELLKRLDRARQRLEKLQAEGSAEPALELADGPEPDLAGDAADARYHHPRT